jgi:hypothetical protein
MTQAYPPLIHKATNGDCAAAAVSPPQLEAAAKPHVAIRALIERVARRKPAPVRPYLIWRDDPELARMVNDRLAERAAD